MTVIFSFFFVASVLENDDDDGNEGIIFRCKGSVEDGILSLFS